MGGERVRGSKDFLLEGPSMCIPLYDRMQREREGKMRVSESERPSERARVGWMRVRATYGAAYICVL